MALARAESRVTVAGLARRFAVTAQSISRDLAGLAALGLVDRVHGGAILSGQGTDPRRRPPPEVAIARLCAAHIPDNSAIILPLGPLAEAVAEALMSHTNLTVITNALSVARSLIESEGCTVILAGGVMRRPDGGLLGELTTHGFNQFKVDCAVIGCSAIDAEGDILAHHLVEARVSKAAIAQARRTFLVADRSSFGRPAPARLASLAQVEALFTDAPLAAPLAAQCRAWNTAVHQA